MDMTNEVEAVAFEPVWMAVARTVDYRLADEFKRDEIPEDMKQLVERLEVFRTGAATLIT